MNKNIFGQNLKFYRKKLKLTQVMLAERSGIGQVSIANYERGTRFPGEETLMALAKSLGLPLDLLFNNYDLKSETATNIEFGTSQLIELLLTDSIKNCQSYINGWKKMNNYSLEQLFSEVIIPTLAETGEKWFKGDISISEEHVISFRIREIISLFSSAEEMKKPVNDSNIWMGFCAPSDRHDLVLFMLSQLLKVRGWKTMFLGADLPLNDLISMMLKYKPSLISISISMPHFQSGLDAYLQKIDQIEKINSPIIIGGNSAESQEISQYKKEIIYVSSLEEGHKLAIKNEK